MNRDLERIHHGCEQQLALRDHHQELLDPGEERELPLLNPRGSFLIVHGEYVSAWKRRSGDPPFPWVRMPPIRYIAWLSTNWWSSLADSKP